MWWVQGEKEQFYDALCGFDCEGGRGANEVEDTFEEGRCIYDVTLERTRPGA